jgi:hypothetical protein
MSKMARMDARKASQVADDYEREGRRYLQLAAEMRLAIKRAQNGHGATQEKLHRAPKPKGKRNGRNLLDITAEVLREAGKPLHASVLPALVTAKRGKRTSRGSIETALVRALDKPEWKDRLERTAPSTFAVS